MFLEDFLIYVRWRWNMWQKWFRNCRPLLDASVMYRFTRPCAIFTQLSFSLFIKHSILNSERFNMTLRQASRETFQILDDKLYSRIKSILNVSQQWIFQYQKNKQYIAEFAVRKMIFLDFAFKVGKLISKCVNGISFGALRRQSTCEAAGCYSWACEELTRPACERALPDCSQSWLSSGKDSLKAARSRWDCFDSDRWPRLVRPWLLCQSLASCAGRYAYHRLSLRSW